MRVMLTSCGLETKKIETAFLEFLGKVAGMRFYERNGFCEMMKTIECQSLD